MKTRSKALLLSLCAVLLVAASVLGTMAYLTSQASVTNTFTVGKVGITLDETAVDEYGVAIKDAARRDANTYKLIPGHTYTKDPTIHVADDSEECWLFVKVVNEITAIEDSANTIAAQMEAKGWKLIDGTTNVYGRETTNNAKDNVVVFESFKISGDVKNGENGTLDTYAGKNIVNTAYAIQAAGFGSAEAAWNAAGLK